MMAPRDITVALNVHDEHVVAGPTMASAAAAIEAARADGHAVEKVIGLDCATAECRTYFSHFRDAGWKLFDLQQGDLGEARNELVKASAGEIIAFLDADDLFSENWLTAGIKKIVSEENLGRNCIVHPELNIFFDAANSCLANCPQDDPVFMSGYWRLANYYDSLAMAPRRAFEEVPYAGRDKENGFGFEDWRWNLETIAAGWKHEIAKDTIIFKRRRDISLLSELGAKKTILWPVNALTIDNCKTPERE